MTEWKEYKLGELVQTNKKSINSDYPFEEIEYLDTGSITRGKIESFQKYKLSEAPSRAKRLVVQDDIIYSTVRPIQRHYGFIDNPLSNLVVSTGFATITCEKDKLNPKFLYYLLSNDDTVEYLDVIAEASTSAYPSLRPSDIENLEITIPELALQKSIVSILSSLDNKIDLLHRQNTTFEKMAETLFRQWFVEDAKDDWEDGNLGEVIEIYDNLRIPLSKMERDKKKDGQLYPYYGAAQIMDYINAYIFDGEYILLGEDGTVRTDEGYPVLQYATGKFWVNNHTHVLKAKSPYNNFFIWNYLKKKNIDEIVTGAVQPKINQANLKSIDFPKYPENLVNELNKISEPFFMKINQNKTQIRTITALRDTLLPKLMSGEVTVAE
jgi:type I restriction enzyme, S subunit